MIMFKMYFPALSHSPSLSSHHLDIFLSVRKTLIKFHSERPCQFLKMPVFPLVEGTRSYDQGYHVGHQETFLFIFESKNPSKCFKDVNLCFFHVWQ